MKKQIIVISGLVIVLGLFIAEETSAEESYPKSAKSEGLVDFKTSDGGITPIDPTTPEPGEVSPVPPNNTTGLLRLDQVPTLDFGTIEIKGSAVQSPANYIRLNKVDQTLLYYVPAYLQLTDERGTNSGWSVTTELSDFTAMAKDTGEKVEGVESLRGATITFKNGQVMNHSGMTESEVSLVSPTPNNDIVLEARDGAGSKEILAASEGQGMGVWTDSFYENDGSLTGPPTSPVSQSDPSIELSVPGTAKKSQDYHYVSTITWTVATTPETTRGL